MDIHKPKPWHGVREFLKEYAIIVVGVLTALAAEQGAEWFTWRARVAEADRAIGAELRMDAAIAAERVALHGCLLRHLTSLEAKLQAGGTDWSVETRTVPLLGTRVYIAPVRVWRLDAWKRAVADGTANHIPHDRALAIGNLYKQIEDTQAVQREEFAVNQEVDALRFFRPGDEAERHAFLIRLQRLEEMESLSHAAGLQLLEEIRALGVRSNWPLLEKGIAQQNAQWGFCGPGEPDFTELRSGATGGYGG